MACIFCEIAQGKANAHAVHKTKSIVAFLDIFPRSRGHSLIMPKKHYESLAEIPEQELIELIKEVVLVEKALMEALKCKGINLRQNYWPYIPESSIKKNHVHIHLVPVYAGIGDTPQAPAETKELAETAEEIKKAIE